MLFRFARFGSIGQVAHVLVASRLQIRTGPQKQDGTRWNKLKQAGVSPLKIFKAFVCVSWGVCRIPQRLGLRASAGGHGDIRGHRGRIRSWRRSLHDISWSHLVICILSILWYYVIVILSPSIAMIAQHKFYPQMWGFSRHMISL